MSPAYGQALKAIFAPHQVSQHVAFLVRIKGAAIECFDKKLLRTGHGQRSLSRNQARNEFCARYI